MAGGRPLLYNTPEEMQEVIDLCFLKTIEEGRPLTITGLAIALGFNTRQSVINYEGKPEFLDTIKKAKLFIERFNEEKLYDKNTPTGGVIFNLANNYNRQNKQTIDYKDTNIDPLKDRLKQLTSNQEEGTQETK